MITDIIKIEIKIKGEDEGFLAEEKTELITSSLQEIVNRLNQTNGNVAKLNGSDEFTTVQYVHVKNVK